MTELTSRYALALFSLKRDENKLLETQQEVKELRRIIRENDGFVSLLDSHYLSIDDRLAIVDKVFASIDEEIKNFIKIIVENNRGLYLLDIFDGFNSLVNEYRGVKEGLVYSAMPLSEKEVDHISKSISEVEKMPIELINKVDPTLIGGIKVVINDHVYDGSIKHQIEDMRLSLLKKEGVNDEN